MISHRKSLLRGMRDAAALPAWVVGLSLAGVGSLAQDVGHPVGAAILSTFLIWAGPAQVIFYGSIATGAAWGAIALAISLSSLRLMPMVVALMPMLRRPGQSLAHQLLLAHFIAVSVWTESLRRLPHIPAENRVSYYSGFAAACTGIAAICTGVGYFLAGALPLPLAAGLLFLTPIFFTISLTAGAVRLADASAILLGFALTPLVNPLVGGGFDMMVTGFVGGTIAYLIGRWRRRTAEKGEP